MTANGLLGGFAAWTGLTTPPAASTTAAGDGDALARAESEAEQPKIDPILNVCDRVIGETSRREHVFDWLRTSGGGQALTVDAYYPRHELVVLCRERSGWDDSLIDELALRHGLRLFKIKLADFRGDSGHAFSRLIGELRVVAGAISPAPITVEAEVPVFRWGGAGEIGRADDGHRGSPPHEATAARAQPFPAQTRPFPGAPQPSPAPRQTVSSAFHPLMAAVQRFTEAPQPFVMPPEPAAPPATQPFAAPLPPAIAAPPPATAIPSPFTVSLPPVPEALRQYLTSQPAAPPKPPARAVPPPTAQYNAVAPRPYASTPLPFVRAAPPVTGLLAHLVHDPEPKPRRVGQRQAEAAARAARFVEARATRTVNRATAPRPSPPAQGNPFLRPANGTPATAAPWALAGLNAPMSPDARVASPSTARERAIERALARGRAIAEPARPPAPTPTAIDPDDIPLGLVVTLVVVLELYFGVLLTFGGGAVVLGLGLAMDAGARALGTIAAARSGKEWGPGWRWICGLGGSAGVIVFTFQRDGNVQSVELAPLVGPTAVVALVLILTGLAGLPVGV